MQLVLKPDWEMSQERYKAWWQREIVDRPLLLAWSRRPEPAYAVEPLPPARTPQEKWMHADLRAGAFESSAVWSYYGGDAFPYFDTNVGPGSYALFLGARPGFDWETVWFHSCIADMTKAPLPEYDRANPWWQQSLDIVKAGARLRGKALTSFPDLVEGLDILASLAGATETLLALVDTPERVHAFLGRITDLYFAYYDRLADIVRDDDGGTCFSAFHIWGPGRTAKLQCDFSAMIGPKMFDEFVAPYLSAQADRLDNVIYHLDGPDAICHLDSLLGIPGINAIQWTPGTGQESLGDARWTPLYRRVRASGKGLVLLGVSPAEAERLTRELGPEGLMLGCSTSTPEEADALVAASKDWKKEG